VLPPPPPQAARNPDISSNNASFRTAQPLLMRLQYTRAENCAERTFGPDLPVF
jgi:hypothetical protein